MSKKKSSKHLLWIIPLILIVLSILIYSIYKFGTTQQTGLVPTFTPIYCNDYEFTCCTEHLDYTKTIDISQKTPFKCEGTKCIIKSISGYSSAYLGSISCKVEDPWYASPFYTCSNEKSISSFPYTMNTGEYLYGNDRRIGEYWFKASIEVYIKDLYFSGRAGSTTGVKIPSDNCAFTFNPNTLYSTGTLKTQQVTGNSYTVPSGQCILAWQLGDRHICGNLEETCKLDSDCYGTYPYGQNRNQQCTARTLQTYGCRKLSPTLPEKRSGTTDIEIPFSTGENFGTIIISRCEITSAQPVQCCGDTDCGSSMVCDTTTFTCKEPQKVKCNQDADCGVSVQCDYSTKLLKKPVCNSAGTFNSYCDYKTESVDCCIDQNCPSGQRCDITNKCVQRITPPQECPTNRECCVNDPLFIDRPCSGDLTCVDGTCSKSSVCNKNKKCEPNIGENEVNCPDDCGGGICIYKGTVYNLDTKGCCDLKGGIWKTETSKSWWKFWEKPIVTEYCDTSFQYWWAVILGFVVIVLILIIILFYRKK